MIDIATNVLTNNYAQPDFVLASGEGEYVLDTAGKRYLDFTSGIAVSALGHNHPRVSAWIKSNACGLLHVSNLYYSQGAIRLAEKLVSCSPFDRAFFCNSGTEANEAAIKYARLYASSSSRSESTNQSVRHRILSLRGGFHGRTLGALSATPRETYQAPFRPLVPGFDYLDPESDDCINKVDETVAAVIVEVIQGEGGVRIIDVNWLAKLQTRCRETGTLVIVDEIQMGMGRTGSLWSFENSPLTPDMMTLAKPLAGGLPIGAVLCKQEVANAIFPGCHGTTFGGGPFVTGLACEVFDEVSQAAFLEQVEHRGKHFKIRLEEMVAALPDPSIVRDVRGRGLIWALELTVPAHPLREILADRGLLVATAGPNVLRLLPPLIVSQGAIDEAVTEISKVLVSS